MNPERYRRLEELFHAALELPAPDRDRFVEDGCGEDAELRADLAALLVEDAHGDPDDLPIPRVTVGSGVGAEPGRGAAVGAAPLPDRVGPYRIVRRIGEGGFAHVYLAEQSAPLRREVALKVLKAGLDTEATLARFAAERRTLAVMNHDGIARIYAAGATDDGRPYFAMEYVPGEPITAYCDRHALGTRDRLRLFAAVCDAVGHAHQKGVVHRDLKPSNVLVTDGDGDPRVKVIDFGIAKAMADDLVDTLASTQQGQFLGTPEYMSPEQAGFGPGDLDTRTDIYSLGVVLYELLTGVAPFSSEALRRAGLAEIQRLIREVDPPRPSTRLSTLGDANREVARRQRTTPDELVRQLRGELDWVVLKAMEKDRERRYAAPAELAADLRRYLNDEPLVARPPSPAYRLRKFARRNRLALTVTVSLLLGLVGVTAGVSVALVEANRNQARIEAALAETGLARDEAEAVTEFLSSMLGSVRPYEGGRDVTVRAALDSIAVNLDTQLGDRPLVAARVRRAIGVAYTDLGLHQDAEPLVRRALADHERLLGPDHPQTLISLDELCDNVMVQDRNAEADSLWAELHARQLRAFGPDDARTIASQQQRGTVLAEMSRYAEAESLLVQSWRAAQHVHGPDSQAYLWFASNLANFYAEMGRADQAEPLLRQVVDGRVRLRGEDHPEVMEAWNNLAVFYADCGRFAEAVPLLERAHRHQDRALGATHPQAMITRNNLAAMHSVLFAWDKAERLYREGLDAAVADRTVGERTIQHMINNLGYMELLQGRLDEAAATLDRAYRLRLEHHGRRHRDTCTSVNNLGELALLRGDLGTADALLTENLAIRRDLLGDEHPHVLSSLVNLGRVRLAQRRFAAADSLLTAAHERSQRTLGAAHRHALLAACHLGRVRLAAGRAADLPELLGPLVAVADSALVARDPLRGALRTQLAASALAAGRREQAADLLAAADPLLVPALTAAAPWRDDWQATHDDLAPRDH